MNINSSLTAELQDKQYRDAFVSSQIAFGIPLQIRALRRAMNWTQEDLARASGMTQPRIAEIEKPGKRRYNIETLLRVAAAFDVALDVNFAPYGKVIDTSERFNPDAFRVPTFAQEIEQARRAEEFATVLRHVDYSQLFYFKKPQRAYNPQPSFHANAWWRRFETRAKKPGASGQQLPLKGLMGLVTPPLKAVNPSPQAIGDSISIPA